MLPSIPAGWKTRLNDETKKPYYHELEAFLNQELADGQTVLPPRADIFNALKLTPYDQVKVLLLGQDPYPEPGDAHGLCFSVRPGVPLPASLKNIYKELQDDVGFRVPNHGYLESWARQGILMLNTVLTVRAHDPNSHRGKGKQKGQRWEIFTDRIIQLVNEKPTRVVFLLWGKQAQEKGKFITQPHHAIIPCAHPSPLAAKKFFSCRCFSKTNQKLAETGLPPIDWQIADV